MTRSNVNVAIRVMMLPLALAASGCDLLLDPQFARIGDSLKLKISKVNRSESGTSAEFVFTVTNAGPQAVNACLGPSRTVSYDTPGPSGISFTTVDHPGCMSEFTVEPGRDMTWFEVLDVPHLPETRVDVARLKWKWSTRVDVAGLDVRPPDSNQTSKQFHDAV